MTNFDLFKDVGIVKTTGFHDERSYAKVTMEKHRTPRRPTVGIVLPKASVRPSLSIVRCDFNTTPSVRPPRRAAATAPRRLFATSESVRPPATPRRRGNVVVAAAVFSEHTRLLTRKRRHAEVDRYLGRFRSKVPRSAGTP